ncbi:MAG: TolC family protein [Candidatus Latescibacterota bacterium]|nr:MAG: TolC family protein [Candidatus Latescibacterota bacterium]
MSGLARIGLPTLLLLLVQVVAGPLQAQPRVVRIGMAVDGPTTRANEVRDLFQDEIREILTGEFEVQFPDDKYLAGDWSRASARRSLEQLLADAQVDLILAMGILVGAEALERGPLAKPTIVPFVLDSEIPGLPLRNGTSGVHNLTYVATPGRIVRDLKAFTEITPIRKLAVVASANIVESFASVGDHFEREARELGIEESVTISTRADVDAVLAQIPSDVDGVYILPLLQLDNDEFARLAAGINQRGLPSFSLFGREEVELGVLAGIGMEDFFQRASRHVALKVQSILLGTDPADLPVAFTDQGTQIAVNMATARQIGVYPTFEIMTEAVLIDPGTPPVRVISIEDAVAEGVAANLDLQSARRAVLAGQAAVRETRSLLLPQIDLSTLGVWIDDDRALLGNAERQWTGSATLNQILYSEPAWANYTIEKYLQDSRIAERERVRLDIARGVSVAYLNLLRFETNERIQRDNLNVTRSNLQLARVRVSVGASSRADILRWESEIAGNRIAVIEASAVRNQAEIEVNRLLNRPAEESFDTVEADLSDPSIRNVYDRLLPYIDNPWDFRAFRAWMVQVAFEHSPELAQIDAAIAAQERLLASTKRAFWLPEFGLQGDVTQLFQEGGKGTKAELEDIGLKPPDDTDWTVALRAAIPLFTGGQRFATKSRAVEDLARLQFERESTAQRVEQAVRSALHAAGASRAAIRLAAEAARASRENLDLVTDSYSRGAATIINLLDAQNAALIAELGAATAIYDFLIDWSDVERAAGRFFVLMSDAEIDAWFSELDAYFQEVRSNR